ncbi:hypothetical protein FA95DRAFT_1609674 [Auriscalpium vulgare]|uniref:Uncharacterized protein n=1 Tax=Auriscalpium vulgare TaxID=40419 RepID=A0ACB8RHI2_9AGAM|nr:hypothetical protein FA95DRAFT_1609674 [Auriscalpium vulgare]
MRKVLEDTRDLQIPETFAGLLELESGDAIFARALNGCACGCEDIIQALLVAEHFLRMLPNGDVLCENMNIARQRVLGPAADRTLAKSATNADTGRREGGTAFERSSNAHPLRGARAYNLGLGYEQPTQLLAPSAGNKGSPELGWTDGLGMRAQMQKAAMELATAGYSFLPAAHCAAMRTQAELVNAPSMGVQENKYFFNSQLNVSPSVPALDRNTNLSYALGFFGLVHRDRQDPIPGLTGMVSWPDLPPGYDPGTFHLVELGVFVRLDGLRLMYFNGLRRHGGTPPRAPEGQEVQNWAYRIVVVCYPPSVVLENHGVTALATLRSADTDTGNESQAKAHGMLTLDMNVKNNPEDRQHQAWSRHATFAADGHVIMEEPALLRFHARSLYLLSVYVLAQLPPHIKATIDVDKFMASFSIKSSDGEYVAPSWLLAPVLNDFADAHAVARRAAADAWKIYWAKCAAFIPYFYDTTAHIKSLQINSDPSPPSGPTGGRPPAYAYKSDTTAPEDYDVPEEEEVEENTDSVSAEVGADGEVDTSTMGIMRSTDKQKMSNALTKSSAATSASLHNASGKRKRLTEEDQFETTREDRRQAAQDRMPAIPDEDMVKDYKERLQSLSSFISASAIPSDSVVPNQCMVQPWAIPHNITRNEIVNMNTSQPIVHDVSVFSLPVMVRDTVTVASTLQCVRSAQAEATVHQASHFLANAQQQIASRHWATPDVLPAVSAAWNGWHILSRPMSVSDLDVRHMKAMLMQHHAALWTWLESVCYHCSISISTTPTNTLLRLAQDISTSILLRRPCILTPALYHPSFPADPYTLPFVRRQTDPLSNSAFTHQRHVFNGMIKVLSIWLGFPQERASRPQAWLICAMRLLLGPDVLYTAAAFDLYCGLARKVLDVSVIPTSISPSALVPFLASLIEEPIFSPDSQEATAMHIIASLTRSFASGSAPALSPTQAAFLSSASAGQVTIHATHGAGDLVDAGSPSTSQASDGTHSMPGSMLAGGGGGDGSNTGHLPDNDTGSSDDNTVPSSSSLITSSTATPPIPTSLPANHNVAPRLQRAINVLKMMEYFIDGPTRHKVSLAPPPMTGVSKKDRDLLIFVATDLDKFLPFREKAPSVKRARTVDGPYGAPHVRTRSGFFSALVFRTILFSCGYLFDHPFIFDGPEKLKSDYHTMTTSTPATPTSYFFDPRCYGAAMHKQVSNAEKLWTATASRNPLSPTSPPLPFRAFYAQVIKKPGFFNVGPLIGYLLTADYVHAGAVVMPSIDEMGTIIDVNGLGSLRGLQLLHLCNRNPSRQEVLVAFRHFFTVVSDGLTAEQRLHMGWDVITAEHFLCKISRLKKFMF